MALLQESPEALTKMIAYASQFPDFPKNFVLPYLANPNYVPPANYIRLEVFVYAMAVITTCFVVARLWVRKQVKGMVFGFDDWLAIPAQILTLGMIVDHILLIRIGGAGRHVYDVPIDKIILTQKLQFAGVLIYFFAIFVIRLSITAFLYRFMGLTSSTKRLLLHFTSAGLLVQLIVQVFAYVFACKPISAGWDFNVRLAGYSSINLPLEIFILTIFYLLMDVWLLALPIYTIWRTSLPLRTRFAVTWVFIFGGVACAGAVAKTAYVYAVFDSYDPLWNGIGFMSGALVEVSFGQISASMPALNHILTNSFAKSLEKWIGSSRFTRWLGSDNGNVRSFQQSFHDIITPGQPRDIVYKDPDSQPDLVFMRSLSSEETRSSGKKDLEISSSGMP